jgi:hypothetical protein
MASMWAGQSDSVAMQHKVRWIEAMVAKKRATGGYSLAELAAYRKELEERFKDYSDAEFAAGLGLAENWLTS